MKNLNGYLLITLLAISTLITTVAHASDVTCPAAKDIKSFARTLPASKFIIDGPGMVGLWAFEVKDAKFTVDNRDWYLATWIKQKVADKMDEAQKFALENVVTLDDGVEGMLDVGDNCYLCAYVGQYGVVLTLSKT